ncbi:DNA translocase FtsK [Bacillus xiapuensis]|uniref:DNA translocase FtsK n=1 Tax=Bacillus xiapuensis TaxID=2014075 RepID=UPI001E56327E|nr:DNA translocase FtsK [Bacillus xiapuensis]
MSLLKKFLGLFREEIEIEVEEDDENEAKEEKAEEIEPKTTKKDEYLLPPFPKPKETDSQEIVTRVAYQYPSREFRLPSSSYDLDRRRRGRARGGQFYSEQPAAIEQHESQLKPEAFTRGASEFRGSSRPFQPSEVASPIYGFNQRPAKQEKKPAYRTIENEMERPKEPEASNVSAPSEREAKRGEPLLLFKPEETKKAFDVEAAASFAELLNEEAAEKREKPEQETSAERQTGEAVSMSAPAAMTEEERPEEKQSARANEDRPRRRRTPFNVIMSKQDRERSHKKKEYNPDPVPAEGEKSSTPAAAGAQAEKAASKPQELTREDAISASEAEGQPAHYVFPPIRYLQPPVYQEASREWVDQQCHVLNETFKNFNVKAQVVNVTVGPSVTRFEVEPEPGVKVSKITNLSDDLKLSLAARNIRIEAPIPGTHLIGIEVPNKESRPVLLSEIVASPMFKENASPLTSALGLNISGEPTILDLKKMPHGLIAGATGSGKSVCINSILVSLLYKAAPHEVKLLLIDPKMVELAPYNGIPHLVSPVITDVKAATAALKWAVEEMERRYELFVHAGVRDITKFNEKAKQHGQKSEHLPYIVIIIDELADLMMMSPADVEEAICRIAQKARACGIHLIVATQRPSVDVITGLIKANIPTRIAFSVSSQVDSRTIIDSGGAEKLLGRGDMLFLNNGSSETIRLQGTFVSDDEIDAVVEHVRKEQEPSYLFKQEELLQKAQIQETEDELFPEACEFVVQQGGASASLLQRHFKIGYNRAARLIEMMEAQGLISEQRAGKPREVLVSEEELQTIKHTSTI